MIKLIKKIFIYVMALTILFTGVDMAFNTSFITSSVEAHSGRTDSSGGHKDNKNKSGLGSYHYHCGGNPPHLHKNGVCPYDNRISDITTTTTLKSSSSSSSPTSDTTTKSGSSKIKITKSIIKEVQHKLNELGYDCGKVDGKAGKKTKNALKKYQEDYDLKVDGIIGREVINSLGIDYN